MSDLYKIIITLGGKEKELVAPVLTLKSVGKTDVAMDITDYEGPGYLKYYKLDITLATDPTFSSIVHTQGNSLASPFPSGTNLVGFNLLGIVQPGNNYIARVTYTGSNGKSITSNILPFSTDSAQATSLAGITKIKIMSRWSEKDATEANRVDIDHSITIYDGSNNKLDEARLSTPCTGITTRGDNQGRPGQEWYPGTTQPYGEEFTIDLNGINQAAKLLVFKGWVCAGPKNFSLIPNFVIKILDATTGTDVEVKTFDMSTFTGHEMELARVYLKPSGWFIDIVV